MEEGAQASTSRCAGEMHEILDPRLLLHRWPVASPSVERVRMFSGCSCEGPDRVGRWNSTGCNRTCFRTLE